MDKAASPVIDQSFSESLEFWKFASYPRPTAHNGIPVACRDRARRADCLRSSMSADAVRSGSANDHTRVDDLGRVSSS
jgi:hypothetical protein